VTAFAVAFVCALSVAPVASGASSSGPLSRLVAAGHALATLASEARSPTARSSVLAAQGEVGRATAPALWIDPSHVLAPGHGLVVFAGSRGALLDLEHAPAASLPSAGVAAVETDILAADRSLAEGAILQALGGTSGLLARARGMILSGDRWAGTSRLDLAAEQYGAGWGDAFQALTELVRVRTAFVSPRALASGAERAIRSGPRIRPAGVHVLAGRRALKRSGKPELLFVGLESCPACAIERWGVVVALSQFGAFSNLRLGQSAVASRPFVRSFTFSGAKYLSPYLSFDPIEVSSDLPAPGGGFQALGRLTSAQGRLLRVLDPRGIAPFIDVANQFADVGAAVSPDLAQGLSWSQLAASVGRPRTVSGRAIAATAEVLTAEICRATGGAPASVCGSAVVSDYTSRLARFGAPATGCPVGGASARRTAVARRTVVAARRAA
jgi:Domain of unknown function (DUF929)